MLMIDGAAGEGGGQVLRTSLSLAAITGTGVRIERIRANRPKPGMMRQHLACAMAVAEICGGELLGAELKSQELEFRPGTIRGGEYRFVIGSSGNVLLLAQTVLPVLLAADSPSEVILEGGTYNTTASPSYDFFERTFLPCLRRMGAEVSVRMECIGFCPAGGGRVVMSVKPTRVWNRFTLLERGEFRNARVTAMGSGLDKSILDDELRIFQAGLVDLLEFSAEARNVESAGSGNVLLAELEYAGLTEVFGVCGYYGKSRKSVACDVKGMVRNYLKNGWTVDLFLADQLLLPLAIGAGGRFMTARPTRHSLTNREVIQKFLDVKIEFAVNGNNCIMEIEK